MCSKIKMTKFQRRFVSSYRRSPPHHQHSARVHVDGSEALSDCFGRNLAPIP